MNPEHWKKIEDIFQSALDLSVEEREAFLRVECGDDSELRADVEKLINRYEAEETFLESPVWTDSAFLGNTFKNQVAESLKNEISKSPAGESFSGRRIGVYLLTEQIGKGGMGMVYAAERVDGEFSQKVAIKLIKRGMDTDFIIQRFRHERQILASLNHPNIAKLLDGGTTVDNSPYFVMEYIEGKPFFKFCETNNLDLRSLLKLFLAVCSAISYAHGRKIIHRDIKPGNILVSEEGVPKLLDFGIAKILDPDLIQESIAPTATQMRLMTPEYASPEQARGDEITPASDQYSLGALLYELVTGVRPYKFPSRAPHEIARVICEEIPTNPSLAENRIASEARHGNLLSDGAFGKKLDRIILKSLRKNISERYASVDDFAADIQRVLDDQTISAEEFETEMEKPDLSINQKSIAVLPFKILNSVFESETGDNGFLSVGLADGLITRLSNIKQLIVRPTSSVLRFGEGNSDSFAVGEELKVRFILDGNILRTEKRIRVSIQLLDVENQATVWAKRFDEEFIDALDVEDSISGKVVESLLPRLTGEERKQLEKRGTDNSKAYETYLRGRFHWNTFTEEGFRQAIIFYRKALELDPNYALAHAAVADYYNWLGMYGVLSFEEFYKPAKEAAMRAVGLDDKLSEAYSALSLTRLYGEYDWQESEREILRALELNPNSSVAHLWYSHNLYTQNRIEKAAIHIKRALELDPFSFQNQNTFVWGLYFARQIDKALTSAERLIEKFPASSFSFFAKSCFLSYAGKSAEALRASEKALELSSDNLFLYGHAQALAAAGKKAEALEIIEKSKTERRYISNYHIAVVCCFLKDKEKAFESLERSFAAHEGMLIWTKVEPSLDILRDDPRYDELLKRINPEATRTQNTINLSAPLETSISVASENSQTPEITKRKISKSTLAMISVGAAILALIIGFLGYKFFSNLKYTSGDITPDKSRSRTFASTIKS